MKHILITPKTFDSLCEVMGNAMVAAFPDNSWMVTWTDLRHRPETEGSGPMDAICFHVRTLMTEQQQKVADSQLSAPSPKRHEVCSSVVIERVYDPELDLDAHVWDILIPGLVKAFNDSPLKLMR
jgi:hypothetical protein